MLAKPSFQTKLLLKHTSILLLIYVRYHHDLFSYCYATLINPQYEIMKRKHNNRRRQVHYRQSTNFDKMTMENVTCYNITQPLDHFNAGSNNFTFDQRYCIYDYNKSNHNKHKANGTISNPPIFFYTGNESPIDEYVNNTGLIWELGFKFSALIVFAEHRFEGTSLPLDYFDYLSYSDKSDANGCFTYLTTTQALADYAQLITFLNPHYESPVITFGGSYGGMLSAWMRLKYGSIVAGSIASSAPIWGLPKALLGLNHNIDNGEIMDRASYVVGQALLKNNISKGQIQQQHQHGNFCYDNLFATWPLISYFGKSDTGRKILSDQFRLCSPLKDENDVVSLLQWAQSPWFDLAEGDYPYPSSYIPYALGEGLHNLPAWPLQEACHGSSGLNHDFGITIDGNRTSLNLDIRYGQNSNDSLNLHIDWDLVSRRDKSSNYVQKDEDLMLSMEVASELFSSVREAVSIWFNVTKSLNCFDVVPAINDESQASYETQHTIENLNLQGSITRRQKATKKDVSQVCQEKIRNETVWTPLVCNDNINLIMTYARGMGRDFYWPPSHTKSQRQYQSTIENRTAVEQKYTEEICSDPDSIFGFPDKSKFDPYSSFLDSYYGGTRIGRVSNIIFSNGLLDPWSGAGVYFPSKIENQSNQISNCQINDHNNNVIEYDCEMVQNITRDGSVIALLLDLGGHHLDLMYSAKEDPPCATVSRLIEEQHIIKWIDEWNEGLQCSYGTCSMS
jgi:pimeloyl-ACP methyl ester carboxylesterase